MTGLLLLLGAVTWQGWAGLGSFVTVVGGCDMMQLGGLVSVVRGRERALLDGFDWGLEGG